MPKVKRIQHERLKVRRPCIALLRQLKSFGAFKHWKLFYWSCPPDHSNLSPKMASLYKLDGYESGVYDLCIVCANAGNVKVYLIEFKYGDNRYSEGQKEVANNAENTPVVTKSVWSRDEFFDFLKQEEITKGII